MEKVLFFLLLLVICASPIDGLALKEGLSIMGILYPLMMICSILYPKCLLPSNKKYITLLICFTTWTWMSLVWSINSGATFSSSFYITQHLLLVIIIDNSIKTPQQLKKILYAYVIGALICSLGMIYDVFTVGIEMDEMAKDVFRSRLFGNSNENSYMISFAILCTYTLFDKYKINKKQLFFLISFIVLAIFSIIISGSRTGFIMMTIIFTLWGIKIMMKPSFSKFTVALTLVGVFIFYVLPKVPQAYIDRLSNIEINIEARNLSQREIIWANAEKMINAPDFNIFVGEGWGSFEEGYKRFTGIIYGAHNFYINQYYTLGIIGLIFLLFYFTILFKRIIPLAIRNLPYILFIAIPMISMMTTNWNHRRWWFFLGIIIIKLYDFRNYNEHKTEQ